MNFVRKVNYYETDAMGIVHHSNYIRWFEEARISTLADNNLDYGRLENMGILIPVLSVSCEYKSSAAFGDTLNIETSISHFDGLRMTIEYTIRDACNNSIKATGTTKHCFLDKNFKPIKMNKKFPQIYDKILKLIESNN